MGKSMELTDEGYAVVLDGEATDGWIKGVISVKYNESDNTMNLAIEDKGSNTVYCKLSLPGKVAFLSGVEVRSRLNVISKSVKKVDAFKPFWVVWCFNRETPTDKYTTRSEAADIAKKLRGKYPESEFHVLCSLSHQHV